MARRKPLPAHIAIGRVAGAQGVRGMVRVKPLTDYPERFESLQEVDVVLGEERRRLRIQQAEFQNGVLIMKFEGVDNREEVATIRGGLLEIPLAEAYPLPEGHHYVYQLVDLPVYTDNRQFLGYVEDVLPTGSNDVYVVRRPDTGKELLLPAIKQVIRAVDLDNEEITVTLLPGLEE